MILYLDTSALLKLYLAEAGSPQVQQAVRNATTVCTHLIAHVEMQAALARALRMGRLSRQDWSAQQSAFDRDWAALQVVLMDENLIRRAGVYARTHGLRAYDSVHLAAADRVAVSVGAVDLVFACFDVRLNRAASDLGLGLLEG